jgi:hypothetical protein
MADIKATSQTNASALNIPEDVRKKFSELIGFIQNSQSMNDEERQYWVDVLPIMSDDQIANLKSILDNEKKQMKEADRQYENDMQKEVKAFSIEFDEIKYKEKKRILRQEEMKEEKNEEKNEEAILAELSKL